MIIFQTDEFYHTGVRGANNQDNIFREDLKKMKFSMKMDEIEGIVARLEKEALPLEDALALFERGMGLIAECQKFLTEARQRVTVLSSDGGEIPLAAESQGKER